MIGRERWNDVIDVPNMGRPTPGLVRWMRRYMEPLVRLCHRPTLTGTEHLPKDRPYMLVANHSAGIGIAELLSFLVTYLRQVGLERPLAGFVLPMDFIFFPLSWLVRRLGAIPSTYRAAQRAFAAGVPIMVFPGGDHESLRPIWQANRVDFGGRLGFLRIARDAGVPIVPMGIRGGHMTAPVLLRSRVLASLLVAPRLLGIRRWGLTLLGVLVAVMILALVPASWPVRALLVWMWLGSPLIFQAWIPWTVRMRIGRPIQPEELFGPVPGRTADEQLSDALNRVQAEVQALVDSPVEPANLRAHT